MKQVLLFPLDLLLDTRLPVMGRYDPSLPSAIMTDPEKDAMYRQRYNDQFLDLGIPSGIFQNLWSTRNANDLVNSRPTRFLFELSEIAQQLIKKAAMEPHNVEEIEFHINLYPYTDLTHDEIETIVGAIKARVQDWVIFKPVFISDKELTAEHIRSVGYTGLFFYDFKNWLNIHYGVNVPVTELRAMPSITIYTALMFDDVEKLQESMEFRNPNGEGCNPLYGLRAMFAPYFYLEGLDTEALCIIKPDELVKQKTF